MLSNIEVLQVSGGLTDDYSLIVWSLGPAVGVGAGLSLFTLICVMDELPSVFLYSDMETRSSILMLAGLLSLVGGACGIVTSGALALLLNL